MNNWLNWLTEKKNETSQFSRSAWFCRTMGWLHWLQDDSRFMAEFQMWISGIAKTKQRHWSILRLFSFFFLSCITFLRVFGFKDCTCPASAPSGSWVLQDLAVGIWSPGWSHEVPWAICRHLGFGWYQEGQYYMEFPKMGGTPKSKKNHRMFHQKNIYFGDFLGTPIGSLFFNGPQSYWNCLDLDPDPGRCGRFQGTTRMEWWDHDPGGHRLQLQDLTRFWDHFARKLPELKPYIPKKGWLTDLYLVKGHNCITLEKHVSSSGNCVS